MNVGDVSSRVVEGVLPRSDDFGQPLVTVSRSSRLIIVRKFGPLSQFAKDNFRAMKNLIKYDTSTLRLNEVERSVMINALLKRCISWSNECVELASFMQLYKEAYDEPLLDEESTVDDVIEYIEKSQLMNHLFRTAIVHLCIHIAVIRYHSLRDEAGDSIAKKDTTSDVTVNAELLVEGGPSAVAIEIGSPIRRGSFVSEASARFAVTAAARLPMASGPSAVHQTSVGNVRRSLRPQASTNLGLTIERGPSATRQSSSFTKVRGEYGQPPAYATLGMPIEAGPSAVRKPSVGSFRSSFGRQPPPSVPVVNFRMTLGGRLSATDESARRSASTSGPNRSVEMELSDGPSFTARRIPIPNKKGTYRLALDYG